MTVFTYFGCLPIVFFRKGDLKLMIMLALDVMAKRICKNPVMFEKTMSYCEPH